MESEKAIKVEPAMPGGPPISDWLECDPFSQNGLLCGIPVGAYSRIAPKIEVVCYEADDVIFVEDDPGSCLYLIAQVSVDPPQPTAD